MDPGLRRGDEVVDGDMLSSETSELTEPATPTQAINLTHWRWVGLRKAKPQQQRPERPKGKPQVKPQGKPKTDRKPQSAAPRPQPQPAAPSALALQLAALKEKMGG